MISHFQCVHSFGLFSFRIHLNRLDRADHTRVLCGSCMPVPCSSRTIRLEIGRVLFFHVCRAQYNAVSINLKKELGQPVHTGEHFWCEYIYEYALRMDSNAYGP